MGRHRQEQGKALLKTMSIVGAVILLAVAGFFAWNTFFKGEPKSEHQQLASGENAIERKDIDNDAYEGWKTYDSPRDNYTIQYPAEWILVPETETDGIYIRNKQPLDTAQTDGYPKDYINLRVLKSTDADYSIMNMTAEGYFNALGTSEVSNGASVYEAGDVAEFTLNGQAAKRLKSVFTETNEDIVVLDGDTLYTILIYPYGKLNDDKTLQQIVASFTIKN